MAKHTLERGQKGGRVKEGVLSILSQIEKLYPVTRDLRTESAQEPPNFLVCSLHLIVSLWMVA